METIDAAALQPLPAWFWFIEFFKVLGFTLHAAPMNLWYAGTLLAVYHYCCGGEEGRRFGSRFMRQLPIIIAFGINFGIVPLLFLQVGYSRAFYPATILMAWFWMAVIVLLVPAYYGVYLYSFGLGEGGTMTRGKRAAGWTAAAMFLVIGFLFANAMSLTTRWEAWRELWMNHNVGGAATGTALNVSDPSLWPRWLLMFGFALITTGAWAAIDATWLSQGDDGPYRRWAHGFTFKLTLAGAIWATAAGGWYVFFTWRQSVWDAMLSWPLILLAIPTMAIPWAPWLVMLLWRRGEMDRAKVAAVAGAQVGVLALNAVSRQVVQNIELRGLFQPGVSAQPVQTEWGSLALFLGTFVVGVGVIVWIFAQICKASPSATVQ